MKPPLRLRLLLLCAFLLMACSALEMPVVPTLMPELPSATPEREASLTAPAPSATARPNPSATPSPTPSASPSASPSAKPSAKPSATPAPSATASQPTQAVRFSESFEIGRSVLGKPLLVNRLGKGEKARIVIGAAIHGDEGNTAAIVQALDAYFYDHPELAPQVSFYFISAINPDGLATGSRRNANEVNLNRNWATQNWEPDVIEIAGGSRRVGGGGKAPFSEPETAALSAWLLSLQKGAAIPLQAVFYHSAYPPTGYCQPSYFFTPAGQQVIHPQAEKAARTFERLLGYRYAALWTEFVITGEAIHWCGEHNLACIDLELPSKDKASPEDVKKHAAAIAEIAASLVK